MIAKFVAALVSVFSGLTKGFATAFVEGADVLLVTGEGEAADLTTFASFGVLMLGCGVIFGVVRMVAGKIGGH